MPFAVAHQGPRVLYADTEAEDSTGFIYNVETGERTELPVTVAATLGRGYWYPIPRDSGEDGLSIEKRLSSAFGNKQKRQNQLVARLKRRQNYKAPRRGGRGKQARTRRKKFSKHLAGTEFDHDQSTHGRRKGGRARGRVDYGEWDETKARTARLLWDQMSGREGTERTLKGIRDVQARMEADPRWDEAKALWEQVAFPAEAVQDDVDRAMELYGYAARMTGMPENPEGMSQYGIWDLEQHHKNKVIPLGHRFDEPFIEFREGMRVTTTMALTRDITNWPYTGGNPVYVIESIDGDQARLVKSSTGPGPLEMLLDAGEHPFGVPAANDLVYSQAASLASRRAFRHTMTVPLDTLMVNVSGEPELNPVHVGEKSPWAPMLDTTAPGQYVVLPQAEYDTVGEVIKQADEAWSSFEYTYGVSPPDAYAYLELGDYSVFKNVGDEGGLDTFVVNDTFGSGGTISINDPGEVSYAMRNLWANTAMDEHRWAIALQMAVRDEFDLDTRPVEELTGRSALAMDDAKATYEKYGPALRVYARAVYDETQDYLRSETNFDSWPIARGMKVADDVYNSLYSQHSQQVSSRWGGAFWNRNFPVELNPLSSWSVDMHTARSFSGLRSTVGANWRPVILRGSVPIEQVWGVSTLGFGAYSEYEVITLGGKIETEMAVYD